MLFESIDYWHWTRLVNFTASNLELNFIPEETVLRVHGKRRNPSDIIQTRPLHAPSFGLSASAISYLDKINLKSKALKKFESDFTLFVNAINFSNHTSPAYRISMMIALLEALYEKPRGESEHDFAIRISSLITSNSRIRNCPRNGCPNKHSFVTYIILKLYEVRNNYLHAGKLKVKQIRYKNSKIDLWQCGLVVSQFLLIQWLLDNKVIKANKLNRVMLETFVNFDNSIELIYDFSSTYPMVRYSFE